MKKRGCLLGATGLVCFEVFKRLLEADELGELTTLARRPIEYPNHNNWTAVTIDNFSVMDTPDDMHILNQHATSFDFAITCLGTTLKQSGSKEAFREIDFGYNLKFAKWMKTLGVPRFILLSASGSSAKSPIFYSKTKGQLEDEIKALGFKDLQIFQPALLLGERKEQRTIEELGVKTMRFLKNAGLGQILKPVATEVSTLAEHMSRAALEDRAALNAGSLTVITPSQI